MSEENNILSLVSSKPKEQNKGYIRVEYNDTTSETIQCDSFGLSDELTGFLVLWSDSSEEMVGFIRANSIKKITILKDDSSIKPKGYSLNDNS